MNLYNVAAWGPDGEDDIIFLVAAATVGQAGSLVDNQLEQRSDLVCTGKANSICLMAEGIRAKRKQILSGPYSGLSGFSAALASWKREKWHKNWVKQED